MSLALCMHRGKATSGYSEVPYVNSPEARHLDLGLPVAPNETISWNPVVL